MTNVLKLYAENIKSEHTEQFDDLKLELLELLGNCPGMADRDRVRELIKLLPRQLWPHVPDRDTAQGLLVNLYIACIEYAPSMQSLFKAHSSLSDF